MPRLSPPPSMRKQEDVPHDKPVTIDVGEEREQPLETEKVETPQTTEAPPPPIVEPEKPEDNEQLNALQQQLEALKKSEQAARTAVEEAQRRQQEAERVSREHEQRATEWRGDAENSRYDAILNALGAVQAEAESAHRDYVAAVHAQEPERQGEAQRRIARAEARLEKLEDGKALLDQQREGRPKVEKQDKPQVQQDLFEASIVSLPDKAKNWLRSHKEFMTDARKNAKIQALHWDAIDAGHQAFGDTYFEYVDEKLGFREAKEEIDHEPQKGNIVVSAPPSRSNVSMSTGKPTTTRITLSAEQREAARISGLTDADYARQVLRLQQEKANGRYGDRG